MKTAVTKTKTTKKIDASKLASDKTLVVVESPAKAKTINKYLGKNYIVEASVGHIKDLSKIKMGVDIDNEFVPKYTTIRGKAEIIKHLKELAAKSNNVLIATDPDREGEAIAWHLADELKDKNPDVKRIVFNEITKNAIKNSIKTPRDIDDDMFHSQQARRVMDRIIGFKVSPFLANTLLNKTTEVLSAGRVQSVGLRLICEREEEINNFQPIEYWNINVEFATEQSEQIKSKLVAFDGKSIKNPEGSKTGKTDADTEQIIKDLNSLHYIKNEEQAKELVNRIRKQEYRISEIKKKQIKRHPASPFTTSLLQQDAARKIGFSNKKTMGIAQRLYEGLNIGEDGVVGLITYMRTDSVRVSPEAIKDCREFIYQNYGEEYLPDTPNLYKSKSSNAQDAHEAVRPTTIKYTPEYLKQYLDKDELALYKLVYNRFIASQMRPAEIEQTSVTIASDDFEFRATGSVIIFNGFLTVYNYQNTDDVDQSNNIPKGLKENEETTIEELDLVGAATKPPARYNEASLVKTLDELGIGRPSTYAQIISTLLDRNYIELHSKAFIPTTLGINVNEVLVKNFPDIFNIDFTAEMEDNLDKIAEGDLTYLSLMKEFYNPFSKSLEKAQENNKGNAIKCDVCGGDMIIKVSRVGRFLGCSNYPKCRNTKSLPKISENSEVKEEAVMAEDVFCDECGSPMFIRKGKYGNFYGCSNYPKCKGLKQILTNIHCPKCSEGVLLEKHSVKSRKKFWGCSNYPKCDYLTNNEPINEKCSECGNPYMEIRYKKVPNGFEKYIHCPNCKKIVTNKD